MFWRSFRLFFCSRPSLRDKRATPARHRFFCAWPVFCACFAKLLIAMRAPKTLNAAIEKRWRCRSQTHWKSSKKRSKNRSTARPHGRSKNGAETVANRGPETPKSEPGRPNSSAKARSSTSGVSEKYQQARTSDFERRKRAAQAQLRREASECPECPKENLLNIYISWVLWI